MATNHKGGLEPYPRKVKHFGLALPGTAHIDGSDDGRPVYGAVSVKISVPMLKDMVGRMFKITAMQVPEIYHKDGNFTVEPIMLHMEEHTECETESPS